MALVTSLECKHVQAVNKFMEAIDENNPTYLLKVLEKNNNGKFTDDILLAAYGVIALHLQGKVEELKHTPGFREDLFQKILYELKEGE